MNNFIQLANVSKIYSVDHKNFFALNHININLNTKEKTVILGKSGSGKSTFLKLLNMLTSADQGSVTIPNSLSISTVFQDPRLLPWLTVEQNALFWAENQNDLVKKYLNIMELTQFRHNYPHQISGGMAQKVALIRAFATQSSYILLDEPFASLDYFTREELQKLLLNLSKKEDFGFLFITHNIDEAILLSDRILILNQGKIVIDLKNDLCEQEKAFSLKKDHFKQKIYDYLGLDPVIGK